MKLSFDQKQELEAVLDYFYAYCWNEMQQHIPFMLYAYANRKRLIVRSSDDPSVDVANICLASIDVRELADIHIETQYRYIIIEANDPDGQVKRLLRSIIRGRLDDHTKYAMYLLADILTKASDGNSIYNDFKNIEIFYKRLHLQKERDRISVARAIGVLADCDQDRQNVVYYPYAGMALASVAVGAKYGLYADLTENDSVRIASLLLMYAHGISTYGCIKRDSENWNYEITPNIVISAYRGFHNKDGNTVFNFSLENALKTMSDDGRFVGITTPKHLFADKKGLIREAMISRRLESIVILPFNEVAVVVRKSPVDNYCLRICEFDYENDIKSLYRSEQTKTISPVQLEIAGYDLHEFLIDTPVAKRGSDLVELGSVFEVVPKKVNQIKTSDKRTRVVRINKDSYSIIDREDENNFIYSYNTNCYLPTCKIDSDVIVISERIPLQPRLLRFNKEVETYVCDGIVLKSKSNIGLNKLCNQLSQAYVQYQLLPFGEDSLNKNPYINKSDLLKVKVYIPNGEPSDDDFRAGKNKDALPNGTILHNGNEKYEILNYLSCGSFGLTYRCNRYVNGIKDKDTVVIKEFYMQGSCYRNGHEVCCRDWLDDFDENRKRFLQEANIMSKLGSIDKNHIMDVKSVFDSEETQTSYYVMTDCPNGSLRNKLEDNDCEIDETRIIEDIILPVCKALSRLHKENILHLDVKPDNILIDDSNKAVLIDFGISKMYDDSGYKKTVRKAFGTRLYMAPEHNYSDSAYSYFSAKPDIFSLAATCSEIFSNGRFVRPIYDYSDDEKEARENLHCSKKMRDAIIAGLQASPRLRPDSILEFARMLPGCENIDLEAV